MFSFPSAYAGSSLCWQGLVLWQSNDKQFTPIKHSSVSCRTLEVADTGQRIFGVSIDPTERLSMRLDQSSALKLRSRIADGARLVGVLAIVMLLAARPKVGDFILPCALIAGALAVVAVPGEVHLRRY